MGHSGFQSVHKISVPLGPLPTPGTSPSPITSDPLFSLLLLVSSLPWSPLSLPWSVLSVSLPGLPCWLSLPWSVLSLPWSVLSLSWSVLSLSCPCPVPILSLSWSVRSLSRLCSGLPCLCPAPCLTLSLASGSRLSGRLGRSESLRVSDRRRPSRGSLGAKGRGGGRSRSDVDMDPSSATAVLGPARRATYVTPLIS